MSRIGVRRPKDGHRRRMTGEGAVVAASECPDAAPEPLFPWMSVAPAVVIDRQTRGNTLVGAARFTVPPIPKVGAGRSPRYRALDSCIPLEESALMPHPLLLASPDALRR